MVVIPVESFADKLNEVMPVVMKEFSRRQANELYKGKITLPQFLVLDCLYSQGSSKMKDLAVSMGVTTAAMTGIIDRLVRDGYVRRNHDEDDRRIINIQSTQKGITLVRKINEQRRSMVIRIFGKVSEQERADYLRILTHIRNILLEEARD